MTQSECTVYRCGFCRKPYFVKHACARHETYCHKNPNNEHHCFSCIHLERGEEVVDLDDNYSRTFKSFTCTKLDKQLHSFVAERIKHSCLGDTERMPLYCADHPDSIETAKMVAARLRGEKPTPVIEFPWTFVF